MMRPIQNQVVLLLAILTLSACGSMGGGLRRDFMTSEMVQPTMGGRWSERGVLADDESEGDDEPRLRGGMYGAIAHRDRRPAGVLQTLSGDRGGEGRWSTPQRDAPPRDSEQSGPRSLLQTDAGGTPTQAVQKKRARKEDFQDRNSNEGSLWASDGQTNYYFTKNKIRGEGDIITVGTEEPMIKDLSREILRSLNDEELKEELALAQARLASGAISETPAPGNATANRQPAAANGAAPGTPAAADAATVAAATPEVREATFADIDIRKSMGIAAGEGIMAEIIERYPNGNYKVRGTKRVPYRNGYKLVTLTAIAKATDISEDDQLTSGKLYEYRLDVEQ